MTTDGPVAAVMITLGARDFGRLRAFYAALDLPRLIEEDDFVAFELRGVVLAVFPIEKLARDGNTEPDLDGLTEQMRAAGATVAKEPVDAEFFTGRSAYLCDPEGNYIEIAWADPTNPIVMRRRRRTA